MRAPSTPTEIPLGIERIGMQYDRVFAVYEDELDVQHVIVFDIEGLPPPASDAS